MTTKAKNQHYVPKFYLRHFSYQDNQNQIGIFNVKSSFYFDKANLKFQGSKNFYYGDDGTLEGNLAEIEGKLASVIKEICFSKNIPPKNSNDYFILLAFVALTHIRNPTSIEGKKKAFQAMRDKLLELSPQSDIDSLIPEISHEEALSLSFGMLDELIQMIVDLDYKILINNTENVFITSDNPIVKYNQYLEQKKWQASKTGFGMTGLQIFVPLNESVTLLLFDSGIYKVGTNKQKIVSITDKSEIEQLNILHFVNCIETIYFNHNINKQEIFRLFEKSKKYIKANVASASINTLVTTDNKEDNIEKDNLLIMHTSDCAIKLNLSWLKIHSKGKSHKLHPSMAQIRPHCEKIRNSRRK